MKFQVLISYDDEFEGYVAEVPELPGCFSQGKTIDETFENVRDAIEGVLLVMQKNGQSYQPSMRPVLVGEVAV